MKNENMQKIGIEPKPKKDLIQAYINESDRTVDVSISIFLTLSLKLGSSR